MYVLFWHNSKTLSVSCCFHYIIVSKSVFITIIFKVYVYRVSEILYCFILFLERICGLNWPELNARGTWIVLQMFLFGNIFDLKKRPTDGFENCQIHRLLSGMLPLLSSTNSYVKFNCIFIQQKYCYIFTIEKLDFFKS